MKNKTTIVTGAAGGIGSACAKILLNLGANVVAFDPEIEKMKKLLPTDNRNLLMIGGDVSKEIECNNLVNETIEKFGQLDSLIHWGATHSSDTWKDLTSEECNRVMNINVTGSFLITQATAKEMLKQKKGSIVLCTSTSVLFGVTGGDGQAGPAYVASKGAVIALMRSFARALGPDGIRVNAVSPGITETPMIKNYTKAKRDTMKKRFPLGRFAEPNEIAEAGIFLISDKSTFVTGETMHVNGGSNFG